MPPSRSAPASQERPAESAPLSNASSTASPDEFQACDDPEQQKEMYNHAFLKKCRLQAQIETVTRQLDGMSARHEAGNMLIGMSRSARRALDDNSSEVDDLRKEIIDLRMELAAKHKAHAQELADLCTVMADLRTEMADQRQAHAQEMADQRQAHAQEMADQRQAHAQEMAAQRQAHADAMVALQQDVARLAQEVRELRASNDRLLRGAMNESFRAENLQDTAACGVLVVCQYA